MKKLVVLVILICILTGCSDGCNHSYLPANYQQPQTCKLCGHTKGEKLEADFEKYEMNNFCLADSIYDLTTFVSDEDNSSEKTDIEVSFINCCINQQKEADKGYAWQHVEIQLVSTGENTIEYGAKYGLYLSDYYDIDGFEDSYHFDSDLNCNVFSVNFNGNQYDKCRCEITILNKDWEKRNDVFQIKTIISIDCMVPVDYDGFIVGIRSDDVTIYADDKLNDYYEADKFLSYRLAGLQ